MTRAHSVLFPETPRAFAGRRLVKILLRAVHVTCAALLLGSHAFAATPDTRAACLGATALSGILLLGLDLHESAVCLVQVRGAVLLGKLLVLAWVVFDANPRPAVLGALMLASVISSHAPASVRYRLLVRSRITASDSRG